jgi:hypothetical protein
MAASGLAGRRDRRAAGAKNKCARFYLQIFAGRARNLRLQMPNLSFISDD